MNFSRQIAGVLVVLTLVSGLSAQAPSDWSAITRIASGTRVEIIHGALKLSTGELLDSTDEMLTLRTDGGTRVIPRIEVKRVSVIRHSRKKRMLIGMAAGAGAGAAIMLIGAEAGDVDIRYDYLMGAGAVLGGAIGAGVGSLVGGPETVYRVP
jgi:hypothetical protein